MKARSFAWAAAGILALTVFADPFAQAGRQIATTKHNLSATGPGTVKATTEGQICIFCHTPHNSRPVAPLWNRVDPTSVYTPYSSSTLYIAPGQPNGTSLMCLSCHDGTVALGKVFSRATEIAMAGGAGATMPAGVTNLGTNLSDDHPISFVYNVTAGELASPATLTGAVRLDSANRVQCTSCHDSHSDQFGKFLVMSNSSSALCVTCHIRTNWGTSDHSTHTNTYSGNPGTLGTPWTHTSYTTVATNACENCHRPHQAPGAKRILNFLPEENNCLVCHNGTAMNPLLKNLVPEFSKVSAHTTATMSLTGVHDPAEAANVATKHVECVDCHNPHQAYGPASTNPANTNLPLAPPLRGARGSSIADAAVNPVSYEYEICFRCHGTTASVAITTAPLVTRQIPGVPAGDMRKKFQTTNPSYHPIAGVGKGTNVPSLIAPWTTGGTMKCTHCHNDDVAPTVGTGTGPNGPHGSINKPILAKRHVYTDPGVNGNYTGTNFALCYSCHSEALINRDAGPFNRHNMHLLVNASCSTCHDPHGVPGGTSTNNSHLINFNTAVVSPYNGVMQYTSLGVGTGRCQLVCHGTSHTPWTY